MPGFPGADPPYVVPPDWIGTGMLAHAYAQLAVWRIDR